MSDRKEARQLEIPSVELLEGELKRTQYNRRYRRTLRTTIFSLLLVAAAAVIIAVLLLPVLQISGSSMENTLMDGDLVISLNNGKYKTGDVIGFYYNNVVLIKRVIATSGDWVDIAEDGTVTVEKGLRIQARVVVDGRLFQRITGFLYDIYLKIRAWSLY